jgi:uncharacterized protein with NAD-binding domain and iron-sulfur cluster
LLSVQTYQEHKSRAGLSPTGREASFSSLNPDTSPFFSVNFITDSVTRLLKYGLLTTTASLIEAVDLLRMSFQALFRYPENLILGLFEAIAESARRQFEALAENDDELRRLWEVIDLLLAIVRGTLRLVSNPDPKTRAQGFDVINNYECREWLRLNGASERSVHSALIRGLYDLAFAYEDGDFKRPRLAAGQAIRSAFRMFFTYRGALFWKMKAGMGDVVFAPFYEVLKKRGVTFRFFHRLENVKLIDRSKLAANERPYIEALEFAVQAAIQDGKEYQPLVDVRGLPCWPSKPDYSQLIDGERYKHEGWDFESFWERRKIATKTLRVMKDFDCVVLAVGIGAIPYVCREIVAQDPRWQAMVKHVKTVGTQAFQVWLREDMRTLGWPHPPTSISAFAQPFDTWADMRQLIPEESWSTKPRAIAYFCSVLPDLPESPMVSDRGYPTKRCEEVRQNALRFLNYDVKHFWPHAVGPTGEFRWELLVNPNGHGQPHDATKSDCTEFDSQFWLANVNPSDRYVLALPGSIQHRISPLDNTYTNLTIAGDWTACGFPEGCVEAAVMSGRLAAHAISDSPRLKDIVGYNHP